MEIKQAENMFYIGETEDERLAEITFKHAKNNVIIADHTLVSETLRGQGVARKLLDRLVEYARKENLKIYPVCSYVVKVMVGNKEFADVITDKAN